MLTFIVGCAIATVLFIISIVLVAWRMNHAASQDVAMHLSEPCTAKEIQVGL
jgi:hypothetical protein